jgi:hypothetical protein
MAGMMAVTTGVRRLLLGAGWVVMTGLMLPGYPAPATAQDDVAGAPGPAATKPAALVPGGYAGSGALFATARWRTLADPFVESPSVEEPTWVSGPIVMQPPSLPVPMHNAGSAAGPLVITDLFSGGVIGGIPGTVASAVRPTANHR